MRVLCAAFSCTVALGQVLKEFNLVNICRRIERDTKCLDSFDRVVASINPAERQKFDNELATILQDASNSIQKCKNVLTLIKAQAKPPLPSLFSRCYNAYIEWSLQIETEGVQYVRTEGIVTKKDSFKNEPGIHLGGRSDSYPQVDRDKIRKDISWRQWTRNLMDNRPEKVTSRSKYDQVDEGPEVFVLIAFIIIGVTMLILLFCYRLKWFYDIWYPPNERAHNLLERPNSIWTPAPPLRHHVAKKYHQE